MAKGMSFAEAVDISIKEANRGPQVYWSDLVRIASLMADTSEEQPAQPETYWLVEHEGLSFRWTKGGTNIITCALDDPLLIRHATEASAREWGGACG